tara:strand:- start:1828 stop:2724 length:897 start_codon:yes stop_codon:yes gene_type:complete
MKNNRIPDISINVLTYKTDKKILEDCVKSINISAPINIIENSKKFENKRYFKKLKKNIKIFCSGKNFGYANGHNYGLSKVKTRYVLICNPDVIFNKNYFRNIKNYLNKDLNFHIIGSQYTKKNMNKPAYGLFRTNTLNPKIPIDNKGLQKVDWVVGCTMLIDLKKFPHRKIFDKKFFLFYEENDLCMRIKLINGLVYSSKKLIINHFGEKGSFATDPNMKIDYIKLRNWHLMWSSFYFKKKHKGFIYSLVLHFLTLAKSLLKIILFFIFFKKESYIKHLYRFLGLINSIIGKRSYFRI